MALCSYGLIKCNFLNAANDLIRQRGGNWTQDPILRWCMAYDHFNRCRSNCARLIGKFVNWLLEHSKHTTGKRSTVSVRLDGYWREDVKKHLTVECAIKTTNLHKCVVDECPSSGSFQHVVEAVLQLSVAFARSGCVAPGSGWSWQRGAQQACAVRRVSALRGGRLASLGVYSGESHELHPPVVVRSRGHEHSDAAVVGWTS